MVATPAATKPQGWTSGPRPTAHHADMPSIPACHLGGFLGGFGSGSFRQRLHPTTTSTAPMRIFTASAASDGVVLGLGGSLPVTSSVAQITTASDASQPNMNAAPFRTPLR